MTKALPVALWLSIVACGAHTARYDYASEPDPRKREYVIGVADHLSIQVWKSPDLSRDVTVRPDGTITLPLVGDLTADGRTPTQVRDDIGKRLLKYMREESAAVTVAVTAVNSYSFTVSGNVERPGVFSSAKYVTALEAIHLAGGPNRFSSPSDTKLFRRERSGKTRVIPIDYAAVLQGKQPEANLVLLPGDQLYVP